jgi:hypothetical protein
MKNVYINILLIFLSGIAIAQKPEGNNNLKIVRDTNVNVSMNGVVACSAGNCCKYNRTDTLLSNSIPTIVFKHRIYDEGGNNYDSLTGIFKAPINGIYNCSAVLLMQRLYGTDASSNDLYLRIDKNDKYLASSQSYYSGGNISLGFSISMDVKLMAGEDIRFKITNSSGTGFLLMNNDGDTRMSIHLVK